MNKADLKIDWATHAAAKFACEKWHYSQCLPVGKIVKVGVWEHNKFIGVVIFGRGANNNMSKCYGLKQDQAVELVRIALRSHKNSVSRISAIAMKFLKNQSPALRLIVSYADPEQGHIGGIYQAGNWIYDGKSSKAVKIFYKGKWSHKKTVDDAGINQLGLKRKVVPGKHRYLMPLDKEMRKQILPLSKPYPKRAASIDADAPDNQAGEGGSNPTAAHQSSDG